MPHELGAEAGVTGRPIAPYLCGRHVSAGLKLTNLLFYGLFFKLAQSVLYIRRHHMICTKRSVLLDPSYLMLLIAMGLTNTEPVRSKLMTRSDLWLTIRKAL